MFCSAFRLLSPVVFCVLTAGITASPIFAAQPGAPGNLAATTISSSEIDLTWTAPSSRDKAASYEVQRCTGATCANFVEISSVSSTSYADTSLTANTTYSYQVSAVDTNGNVGPDSGAASSTTQAAQNAPSAPGHLTASASSSTQVSISWTASSSSVGLANYTVQRCQGSKTCRNFSQIATVSAPATAYQDNSVSASTTYRYRVLATDTSGNNSPYSNTASATTPASQQVPASPVITSATTASGTEGVAFSCQITATNSPTSYGATGLPAGLGVNSSSGAISGTPTAAGTFPVALSATNSGGTGNATLTLTIAAGATQLAISPSSVAFSNVNVGSNATQTVTLTNSGTTTLNISAASIKGTGYTMTLQPTSINAGANTTFTVTFTPTSGGSASGNISITSNANNSPATILLSSTGLQAQISANPASIAFGTVPEGVTDSQSITLKNAGNATLTFSGINVTGSGFNQSGLSTSTTIAAGASVMFSATFDPSTASASSGSITLTTNATPSSLAINISGTGQAATVTLGASPSSLAFGSVVDGSSSSQTTSITNTGNSNITISAVNVTGAGFSASGIANTTTLTPGQSATLTVTFAPTSGGAVSGASVSIASNATNSPTAISLSGTGSHSAVLGWGASQTGGVQYNVYRGTASGAEGTTPINPSPVSALTYTDTNVTAGTEYYYTVEAVDSGGNSTASNEASATIPTP